MGVWWYDSIGMDHNIMNESIKIAKVLNIFLFLSGPKAFSLCERSHRKLIYSETSLIRTSLYQIKVS